MAPTTTSLHPASRGGVPPMFVPGGTPGGPAAAAREPRVSARMTNRDRIEIRIFQVSVHVSIGWFVHCIPVPRAHVRVSHRDLVQILQKLENLTVNKVLDRQRHLTQKPSLHGNESS